MKVVVPRSVTVAASAQGRDDEAYLQNQLGPRPLHEFRQRAAWVLLGEPGAGKSQALRYEAQAVGGKYLRLSQFIHDDPAPDWHGCPLFLDGLDEIRAGGSSGSLLAQLRRRLNTLGNPPFRLACRAADWRGASDSGELEGIHQEKILALQLEPLRPEDIAQLLAENHGVSDPADFMGKAESLGFSELLGNPYTLGLLAKAFAAGGTWPGSRRQTFELACFELVKEPNREHRDAQRASPLAPEALVQAAGQLCAVLLLSGKTGLALDMDAATEDFLPLTSFNPPDLSHARQALDTCLFVPEGEERLVPNHRSVAEFLGARWLGQQVDRHGLPLGRLLNLLLGKDGKTVAGLRGLYGWLAALCVGARRALVQADPLTVAVYGDAAELTPEDKKTVFEGLRQEASYTGFRRDGLRHHEFSGLVSPELAPYFLQLLKEAGREDSEQAFVDCVLEALGGAAPIPGLKDALRTTLDDPSWWPRVHSSALVAWLKQAPEPEAVLALLKAVAEGRVVDEDEELLGLLLAHAYPSLMGPEELFAYFRSPKNPRLIGQCRYFWERTLADVAPTAQLPALMAHLPQIGDSAGYEEQDRFCTMAGALLARALESFGCSVSGSVLRAWLRLGQEHEHYWEDRNWYREASAWLSRHPEQYKAVLKSNLDHWWAAGIADKTYLDAMSGLSGVEVPGDLGRWCVEQAGCSAIETLSRAYIQLAARCLLQPSGNEGLALEALEAWASESPGRDIFKTELLSSNLEMNDWRPRSLKRKETAERKKAEATAEITPLLGAITSGAANPSLLDYLACAWVRNDKQTPEEYLARQYANSATLYPAALSGIKACLGRKDIPSAGQIFELVANGSRYFLSTPVQVGATLLWNENPGAVMALPEATLASLLAFHLTWPMGKEPPWLEYLLALKPGLVAELMKAYVAINHKHKNTSFHIPSALADDPRYEAVARLIVPEMLATFPLRPNSQRLNDLHTLLLTALRYRLPGLEMTLRAKVEAKSVDVAAKIYWLGAGLLLNPEAWEEALWQFIGASSQRARHLAHFLRGQYWRRGMLSMELTAKSLGALIELLAPHAVLDWGRMNDGAVTEAVNLGDQVRGFITQLGNLASDLAADEIRRLQGVSGLAKLKHYLAAAFHDLRLKQREREFRYLTVNQVAEVLSNQAPSCAADMAALILDALDDIARELHAENDDGFRHFWNVEKKLPSGRRDENLCRDEVLERLRSRLQLQGVTCQPEVDQPNDKRADIGTYYRNEFFIPIEIKCDDNPSLWTGLKSQLMGQYTLGQRSQGHGIYLVLWFGGSQLPPVRDGGRQVTSPQDLQARLTGILSPEEQARISVRVWDVSWPK